MSDWLHRAIVGGLRSSIHDHGPITPDRIGSAARRIRIPIQAQMLRIQRGYKPAKRWNRNQVERWWNALKHGGQDGN